MMRSKLALPLLQPVQLDVSIHSRVGEPVHSFHPFPAIINDFISRSVFEKRQEQSAYDKPGIASVSLCSHGNDDANHPAAFILLPSTTNHRTV